MVYGVLMFSEQPGQKNIAARHKVVVNLKNIMGSMGG